MTFDDIALKAPRILVPRGEYATPAWPVVACDQYTSQPDYWQEVERRVGESPSTLHMILPELYLESSDVAQRIERIHASMRRYIDAAVMDELPEGMILVERTLPGGAVRRGLVAALDLEQYDFSVGSASLIRATEGTIVDRLPPRVRIRESAPLELPHIMVLIDDPQQTVIEPLVQGPGRVVYDIELMLGAGRLVGRHVTEPETLTGVAEALRELARPEAFAARYGLEDDHPVLLYAMGDGNHSLATAKRVWQSVRDGLSQAERADHPARFALVELVNLHDEALQFEPIHRVVFECPADDLLHAMATRSDECGMVMEVTDCDDESSVLNHLQADAAVQHVGFVAGSRFGVLGFTRPSCNLPVGTLQQVLDDVLPGLGNPMIDYIHGRDVVTRLGGKPGNVGFYVPAMPKDELFKTVILDGALPRKTFSMGEADEKRFYMECRAIERVGE